MSSSDLPGQVASDVCQLDDNGNPKVGTCWDGQLVWIAAITSILIEYYGCLLRSHGPFHFQ